MAESDRLRILILPAIWRGRGRSTRLERTEETDDMEGASATEALGDTRGLSEATGSARLGLARLSTKAGPGEELGVMDIAKFDESGGLRCSVSYLMINSV